MQLLRISPYPLSITYDVPEANTDYILVINEGTRNVNDVTATVTSSASSKITYELPELFHTYDESYSVTVYEAVYVTGSEDPEEGDIVVEDNLEILRPYVDPSTLGTTASEISQYTQYEGLARTIIDSIVPKGFYYERSWYELVGNNNDFIPLWDRTYKILKAYENNELVWDSSLENPAIGDWNYLITKDKTSIIKDWVQPQNSSIRFVGDPVGVPLGYSDSLYLHDSPDGGNTLAIVPGVTFPMGWNYLFQVETGYKVVPYDIKDATLMLIEDIKCGKLDYYKRSVLKYSTDQYRIEIDKGSLEGTGNILVDKILNKYITNVGKPGVL